MNVLAQPGAAPVRTVLSVPGMHCAGCMGKVERGLSAMPGVAEARVNLSARTVAVTHSAQVEEPDLIDTLVGIGFEAQPRRDELTPRTSAVRPLLAPFAVAGFAAMNVMTLSVSVWSGADGSTRTLFHWLSALIGVPDDDSLISVLETAGDGEIMIGTKLGLAIRFNETEIRPMGRSAYGVRGIRFKKASDEVVSVEQVDESCTIFTVTQKGYGKCAPCSDYRLQARGGSGIINVRCGIKNGSVVSLNRLSEKQDVILVTDTGRTIRFRSSNIPVQKRGGLGVKLMGLREGEVISGVAIVEAAEDMMEESIDTTDSNE